MRGSWMVVVDPTNPNQMVIRRGSASVKEFGPYDFEDAEWVRSRLHSQIAFESNLKADPYNPVAIDPLIDKLRKIREELGLTYQDVATPMGSDSSIIKRAEEGRSEPKWGTLKLWAWLLGHKIELVRK